MLLLTACGDCYDPYDPYACNDPYVADYPGLSIDPWGYCSDPFSCGGGCLDPYTCLTTESPAPAQPPEQPGPAGTDAPSPPPACSQGDTACLLRITGTEVNHAVRVARAPVDALLASEPHLRGDELSFGPLDLPAEGSSGAVATFRLSVARRLDGTTWKLEAKPLGAADVAYRPVFTGRAQRGSSPGGHRGVVGVDLDALAAANPAVFAGTGSVLGSFTDEGRQKATAYRVIALQATRLSPRLPDGIVRGSTDSDGRHRTTLDSAAPRTLLTSQGAAPTAVGSASLDVAEPPAAMPDGT